MQTGVATRHHDRLQPLFDLRSSESISSKSAKAVPTFGRHAPDAKKAGLNPTFRFHLSCASTSVVTIPSEFPIRIWV